MPCRLALAALLALGSAAGRPPEPAPREYVEEVQVRARGEVAVRSGVVQVQVVDAAGAPVHGLAARDFRLNRGEVEVVAAAEVRMAPAVQLLVDLTTDPWRPAGGAATETAPQLARLLCDRLARDWPDGRSAIALLDVNGVQRWTLRGLPGEPTWAENRELAERLAASPGDPFARPLAPMKTLFDKRLHEQVAALCPALSGWRLAEDQHFLLAVTDGWTGSPLAAWRIVRNGDACSLWPRDARLADEAALQRAFLADRVHPLLVDVPPPRSAASDLFGLGRCADLPIWTMAPREDASRLASIALGVEGVQVDASGSAPDEVADRVVAAIRARLDFYWIAWQTPASARIGESFVKVDVPGRDGARAVPDRVGGDLLLRQDPYLAPYVGPLDALPARFAPALAR